MKERHEAREENSSGVRFTCRYEGATARSMISSELVHSFFRSLSTDDLASHRPDQVRTLDTVPALPSQQQGDEMFAVNPCLTLSCRRSLVRSFCDSSPPDLTDLPRVLLPSFFFSVFNVTIGRAVINTVVDPKFSWAQFLLGAKQVPFISRSQHLN